MAVASSIHTIPFDLLISILQYLTPAEITRLEQACKTLQESISERSIWRKQNSFLRTGATETVDHLLSTEELRNQVIRETKIDKIWREDDINPTRVRRLPLSSHPAINSDTVTEVHILDGSNHILVVSDGGEVETISISRNQVSSNFVGSESRGRGPVLEAGCDTNENPLELVQHSLLMPGAYGRYYLILELVHADSSDHNHIRIWTLQIEPLSVTFELYATFLSGIRETHSRSLYRNLLACLHNYSDGNINPLIYLSVTDISTLRSGPGILNTEFRFHLVSCHDYMDYGYDLAMVSENRVIVLKPTSYIAIYDIPERSGLRASDLYSRSAYFLCPIWSWEDQDAKIPRQILSSFVSYSNATGLPTCYIIDAGGSAHVLKLSPTGSPVQEHRQQPADYMFPFWISHSRGLYRVEQDNLKAVMMKTVAFEDPMESGSIQVHLENDLEFWDEITPSFDELTGAVCFVAKDSIDQLVVLVAEIL